MAPAPASRFRVTQRDRGGLASAPSLALRPPRALPRSRAQLRTRSPARSGWSLWTHRASRPPRPMPPLIGAGLVLTSAAFLPYGMAAAAGAMLYVVVEELIPETVRSG